MPAQLQRNGLALHLASTLVTTPLLAQSNATTHSTQTLSVVCSRDETWVATTARQGLRIWSLPRGELTYRLDEQAVDCAEIQQDGDTRFHITLTQLPPNRTIPIRAYVVDPATCATTPAPLSMGTEFLSSWGRSS
jgi:hypothetical protein